MQSFGQVLHDARTSKGMTLRELETQSDVHYSYLSRIENGCLPHPPSEDVVRQLCRVLSINPDKGLLAAGIIPGWFEEWLVEHPNTTLEIVRKIERGEDPRLAEKM